MDRPVLIQNGAQIHGVSFRVINSGQKKVFLREGHIVIQYDGYTMTASCEMESKKDSLEPGEAAIYVRKGRMIPEGKETLFRNFQDIRLEASTHLGLIAKRSLSERGEIAVGSKYFFESK